MTQRYDALAAGYDKRWRNYNRATTREVLRVLPQNFQAARVLDIGAGTGFFAAQLLKKQPQIAAIVALDPSSAMLRIARQKLESSSKKTTFVQGEAEKLPFENAKFDLVVSMNTLHYLQLPRRFFDETHRVLDVGGTLIVQDYTRNDWPLFEKMARIFDRGTQKIYAPRELSVLAERAGFHVEIARVFRITRFWRGVVLQARKL